MPPDNPLSDSHAKNVREMLTWATKNVWGSQELTGAQLGIGQVYISQMINGVRDVTAKIAVALAQKLGVSYEDLVSGSALEDAKLGLVISTKASRNEPREKAIRCLAVLKELSVDSSRDVFDQIGYSIRGDATAEEWLAEGLAQYGRNLLGPGSRRFSS